MRIYMVAFSEKGRALAEKIQNISLSVDYGNVPCEGKKVQEKTIVYLREKEPLDVWVDLAFMQGMPLVFIGAAGIAVRAIAPFIEKKTVDSPVLVIDENAQYVVPVLSGHLGGANELARQLAEGLHGHAVVTTATDCAGCFAVDLLQRKIVCACLIPAGLRQFRRRFYREIPYRSRWNITAHNSWNN